MALPITIPYTFGTQTNSIPLSQLDTDFSTVATALNGVSDGSSPLANVNIVGGNVSGLANPISVPSGGTGYNSLNVNSLLVGNGNSAVQFLAPGTSGNILYSNGTAWTSTAFIPQPGTAANVLTSNGTAWISQSGLSLPSQTGNAGTVLKTNGSVTSWNTALNLGNAVSLSSQTSILFTNIPSWAKRITIVFDNITLSGSDFLVQIGSGSVTSSGYLSGYGGIQTNNTNSCAGASSSAGFNLKGVTSTSGIMVIQNISGNIWISNHSSWGTYFTSTGGGYSPSLSGSLDRINITTVSGSATFNSGSINISWE